MKKILLSFLIVFSLLIRAKASAEPSVQQLYTAYNYAYTLYQAHHFEQAKDLFKKIATISTQPSLNGNALYYYSQCAFRTGDYDGCVKGLSILVKKWPNSPAIQKGYVSRFSIFLIDQVSKLQTNWDYYRYKETTDEKGQIVWKESVPPGFKIKRINFRLGFGLYRILTLIQPNAPETTSAKQKLQGMLNAPITLIWIDEKAPVNRYGHPEDFFSFFSTPEKKDFSKVICDRMFYNWKTDKFYQFLDMYDDVRNEKPRFIAKTKSPDETASQVLPQTKTSNSTASQDPTAILTLAKLFQVAGYNPYDDSFTDLVNTGPADMGL